ncbi:hypothetical protein E4631_25115 [Hymenobacter sp. UV11]|uniref:hypothetical protein n=1 Tax=Hymenobacter sp. UV11 TaxID=1849735 RepID=UPI0010761340|nr:hypothetical protein [Hymenobacter sp. UV11]TFZ62439.1 hypothetical protein E4631_25115 [Hymenobacter sp. UV11]
MSFFSSFPLLVPLLVLTVFNLFIIYAKQAGRDGADQLQSITLLVLCLAIIIDKEGAFQAALFFISFQLLLAYSTSGIAKLLGSEWRKGRVVSKILSTESHGSKKASYFLNKYILADKMASYMPILLFSTLPMTFFFGTQELLILHLSCIFMFHLGCALLMGLNNFLFAFPFCYPAIIYSQNYKQFWVLLNK